jgi:hypothetical protein
VSGSTELDVLSELDVLLMQKHNGGSCKTYDKNFQYTATQTPTTINTTGR